MLYLKQILFQLERIANSLEAIEVGTQIHGLPEEKSTKIPERLDNKRLTHDWNEEGICKVCKLPLQDMDLTTAECSGEEIFIDSASLEEIYEQEKSATRESAIERLSKLDPDELPFYPEDAMTKEEREAFN